MFTSACIVFLVISTVMAGDEDAAKLRFYHGTFDNYTEMPLHSSTVMMTSSWLNSSRTTLIYCHGYTGGPNGPASTAMMEAYLEEGKSNVAFLNWDRLATAIQGQIASSYLNSAVPNAVRLGSELADALLNLSAAGLDLNNTHLVGHSLGAHIIGIAGNKLAQKGIQLPWITGLDPAGVAFDSKPPRERLNPNSARFVDVIHSDPSKYGSKRELGTVDFWPNHRHIGPVIQPGCDNRLHPRFSPEDLCSHQKCWQYLADSMKYPGSVLGSYARNVRVWKNYTKQQRYAIVLELGKYQQKVVPGNYYFVTTWSSPHGLGVNGL